MVVFTLGHEGGDTVRGGEGRGGGGTPRPGGCCCPCQDGGETPERGTIERGERATPRSPQTSLLLRGDVYPLKSRGGGLVNGRPPPAACMGAVRKFVRTKTPLMRGGRDAFPSGPLSPPPPVPPSLGASCAHRLHPLHRQRPFSSPAAESAELSSPPPLPPPSAERERDGVRPHPRRRQPLPRHPRRRPPPLPQKDRTWQRRRAPPQQQRARRAPPRLRR